MRNIPVRARAWFGPTSLDPLAVRQSRKGPAYDRSRGPTLKVTRRAHASGRALIRMKVSARPLLLAHRTSTARPAKVGFVPLPDVSTCSKLPGLEIPSITFLLRKECTCSPQEEMYLPKTSSSGALGRISLNAASVSLEGLAVLLDEGLQRHGRAAADRLDHVVDAGEDAGLVVERHLVEVLQEERLL